MAPHLSSPLLAVLLVTSSSRGPALSFRFPKRPQLEKRYSKVRYLVAKNDIRENSEPTSQRQSRRNSNVNKKDQTGGVGMQDDEMNDDFDAGSTLSEDFDEGSTSDSSSSEEEIDDLDLNGTTDDDNDGEEEQDRQSNTEVISATLAKKDDVEVASSVGGTSAATKEAARHARRRKRAYEQYLGYDCETLASLLAPKRELCHQKFELVIDDLAFVGHPVCVDRDGNWETEDIVFEEDIKGRDETRVDSPSGYRLGSPNQGNMGPEASASSATANPMTLFHFVLVLDRPDPVPDLPALDLTSWLQIFYENVAFKMTEALFTEEVRCQYVSQECEKIGALRERCMDDGQSYSSFLTHANHTSSLAKAIQQLYTSISSSSNAFITINESIDAHLQLPPMIHEPAKMMQLADIETPIDINDAIFTSARAGKDGLVLPSRPINAEQLMYEEWSRTTGPFLLPWKTLLMLRDQSDDMDDAIDLPPYANKGFEAWSRKFISLMKPSLEGLPTFSDSADLLGWKLEEDVYPLVRHLIYYREARVIDVPRIQNYYAVSPLFDLAEMANLSTSWSIKFPALSPLPSFLATLSSALKPFSTQINRRDQRQLCLDALIWLLRHEIVVQTHVRLRLVANEACKRKAAFARDQERERIRKKRALIAERRKKEDEAVQNSPKAAHDTAASSGTMMQAFDTDLSQSAPAIGGEMGYLKTEREHRGRTLERSLSPHREENRRTTAVPMEITPSALTATRPDGKSEGASPSPKPTSLLAIKMGHNPSNSTTTNTSTPNPEDVPATYEGDELRFERRPVLRSRSPSRIFGFTPTNGGAPGSFGTHRSTNVSRPSTPRGRGKFLTHSRESSAQAKVGVGEALSALRISNTGNSDHEDTTVESAPSGPLTAMNLSKGMGTEPQNVNRIDRRKRSPSQARLRVTGFGEDEEVYMDESKKVEDLSAIKGGELDEHEDGEIGIEVERRSRTRSKGGQDERHSLKEEVRRLSLVGEEKDVDQEKDADLTAKMATSTSDEMDDSEDDELYLTYDIEFESWETQPIASIIAEPSRASGDENEWIAAMVEGKEAWEAEKMYKILPFLNGKHTVDEIVYRLDWRRKDLRAVLAAFQEDILTFVHP